MKLSLGPVLFYWSSDKLQRFYDDMAQQPLDVIYLGETVCAKRRAFSADGWLDLARHLQAKSGAEIVLSTLTLIEAASDLATLKRLCNNGEFLVEANDMGAVHFLIELGLPFVAGPALNLYNGHALAELCRRGLRRWVPPVEASSRIIREALEQLDALGMARPELEIFAYGHLPLAYSARCFTARAENRPKDECEFCCLNYAEGIAVHSQEGEAVFTLNGIQTMSGKVGNLLPYYAEMQALGADMLRLSPRDDNMTDVIQAFDGARRGQKTALAEDGQCNGYWRERPGMSNLQETHPC